MKLSRELLEAKLAEANALLEQRLQQANAARGSINTLEHLLAVLDLPEQPAQPPAPPAA